jgi:predicted RNA binding protein YcfA (HicA-like mRNA interferase family)
MKLPRDISGIELAGKLRIYGYSISRQRGSHIRMVSVQNGSEHHITIPAHNPLKLGMLQGILSEVAQYLKKSRDEIVEELFG